MTKGGRSPWISRGPVRAARAARQSRAAVLRAASELIHEVGLRAMTTEEIAARSGASKATIYKWWPNKYAVAVEAFLSEMAVESADPDTGSAREDFRLALRGMVHFYTSESGRAYAQLVGEAQFDRRSARSCATISWALGANWSGRSGTAVSRGASCAQRSTPRSRST